VKLRGEKKLLPFDTYDNWRLMDRLSYVMVVKTSLQSGTLARKKKNPKVIFFFDKQEPFMHVAFESECRYTEA
jgi:hypothetical protein